MNNELLKMAILNAPKNGLRYIGKNSGVDTYGSRYDSMGVKGAGYFGLLPAKEGFSSEISVADESGDYPLMVPTLNKAELDHLLSGNAPTDAIYEKARSWADFRRNKGLSPYAETSGLKYPLPQE